jgi:hypothetical protein
MLDRKDEILRIFLRINFLVVYFQYVEAGQYTGARLIRPLTNLVRLIVLDHYLRPVICKVRVGISTFTEPCHLAQIF